MFCPAGMKILHLRYRNDGVCAPWNGTGKTTSRILPCSSQGLIRAR